MKTYFQDNSSIKWPYYAGVFDRKASFSMRIKKNVLDIRFALYFSNKDKAILYQKDLGGRIKSRIDKSKDLEQERNIITLSFNYQELDLLLPLLKPYVLKKDIYFYVKFREIKRVNLGKVKMSDEDYKLRLDLYNEWLEYARSENYNDSNE